LNEESYDAFYKKSKEASQTEKKLKELTLEKLQKQKTLES
jgi:hypothetical protein